MDHKFEIWWEKVGHRLFSAITGSAKGAAEAAFQYALILGRQEKGHFPFTPSWETVFWNLHTAALAYGKTPDEQADTQACKDRLERLKAVAFQYREAYDKFHTPEDHVVFRDSNNVEVWGYEKDGKLTITRTRIVR